MDTNIPQQIPTVPPPPLVQEEQKDTTTEIPEEIASFLEGVLVEAKMYTNDKEVNKKIIAEMYIRFTTFLNARILDQIPADKLDEFEKITTQADSAKEVDDFIEKNIPNVQAVYNTIFLEFRDMYLGNIDISELPDAIPVS